MLLTEDRIAQYEQAVEESNQPETVYWFLCQEPYEWCVFYTNSLNMVNDCYIGAAAGDDERIVVPAKIARALPRPMTVMEAIYWLMYGDR